MIHDWGKVKEVCRSYLNVLVFTSFYTTLTPPNLFFQNWLAGEFCEKVKQYPVQYDKQMKGYREKRYSEQCEECEGKRLVV